MADGRTGADRQIGRGATREMSAKRYDGAVALIQGEGQRAVAGRDVVRIEQ